MKKAVEIQLRYGMKNKYLEITNKKFYKGNKIIVLFDGFQYSAEVASQPFEIDDEKFNNYTKAEYVRDFTDKDEEVISELELSEMEGKKTCKKLVQKNNLEMKIVDCEMSFDKKKVLFNFTADDRVDFRNLVKDLVAEFKIRVELRQIGVRDEAKILGGLATCGRTYCCRGHLNDFESTTIKMAKNQHLSLNPEKISGSCGRLKCCLANEDETYKYYSKNIPSIGDMVETPNGRTAIVSEVNILKQKLKMIVNLPNDERDLIECGADEVKLLKRKRDLHKDNKKSNSEMKDVNTNEKTQEKL